MPRFGRQRSLGDYLSIAVLLVGFSVLAVAFHAYTNSWLGVLLPAAYLTGLWAALRTEVRELEIADDRLLVRTFFRTYAMPRAHVIRVVRTPRGPAVEVLNGNRYAVSPFGTDTDAVAEALEAWMQPRVPSVACHPERDLA